MPAATSDSYFCVGFQPGKLIENAACWYVTWNTAKKVMGAREEEGDQPCSIQLQGGA